MNNEVYDLVRSKAAAAKEAARALAVTDTAVKNKALLAMAEALIANQQQILYANALDMQKAVDKGIKESMLDRLKLTFERIEGMADGLRQVASLPDPVGDVVCG